MTTKSADTVLVGLTGSIGAGKSTVADLFENEGIPVLRADLIARELMTGDPVMIAAIGAEFGDRAYVDGGLDRGFLAGEIFNDPEKLERMNLIVHPRTIAEQGSRASRLFAAGSRVVACEAALIFETGGENRFDYVVVVDAEREIRLARAASREGSSREEIERRDAVQIPAEQKVERADFVIRNNGDRAELERNTRFVISLLKALPPRERLDSDEEADQQAHDRMQEE